MKKYKYLLFDADNTLFDFNKAERQAFLSVSDICPEAFSEETYHIYHSANDRMWKRLERGEITKTQLKSERFRVYLSEIGVPFDEAFIKRITEYYPICLGQGRYLIDGALEVVGNLSREYEIYIITNGLSDVQTSRFSASPISEYVKRMFISESVGYDKPDRRYFDFVTESVGDTDRSKYLVIGDSLTSDMDGAIAAGIDSVYFASAEKDCGGRKITYRITSLKELYKIL